MKRAFVLHLSFLFAINLLIKPLYLFGIDRSVQNLVGPESYGWYWTLFNLIYLFQVINDLGLQNFTTTFVGRQRSGVNKYFSHLAGLKVLSSLVFVVVTLAVSWVLGYLDWQLLIPIIISQVGISVVFFLRAGVAGMGMYRWDSILSVFDKFLMIVLCGGALLYSVDFNIYGFARFQAISIIVTAIVAVLVINPQLQSWKPKWSRLMLLAMAKKSFPYALTFILTTIYTRIDAVMLERLLTDGTYQVGVYAAGYRLLDACNMMAFLFIGLLLPMFSNAYKDRDASQDLFQTATLLMLVLVVGLSVPTILFSEDIMSLLYVGANKEWYEVLSILMMAFMAMGLSYISGAFLLAHQYVGKLNVIYLSGVVINVVGNAMIIPQNGVVGAAKMTLITQLVVTGLTYFFIWQKMKITLPIKGWGKAFLYVGGGLLVAYVSRNFMPDVMWYVHFAVLGAFFAGYGLILGMVPIGLLFEKNRI